MTACQASELAGKVAATAALYESHSSPSPVLYRMVCDKHMPYSSIKMLKSNAPGEKEAWRYVNESKEKLSNVVVDMERYNSFTMLFYAWRDNYGPTS
ncbi:MAG: hypothetical protein ACN2B6_12220 [Rickettsiales bacterium]